MNIKSQILTDKFIAKPVAYILNFIVRIAGKIFSINHSLDREFKTIAVSKFKGMGSIIQTTPMLAAIRKKYPNAQIIFVSTKSNKKILERIKLIDTIITIDDSSFIKLIASNIKSLFLLMKIRPEVYFDLEIYSDYSTLFTLFTLSINRIGFYLRSSSFRMGIYTHMMFFNQRISISQAYLQFALLIGCDIEDTALYPLADHIFSDKKIEKKYIVINPNASELRLERRWEKDNFIELIRLILNNFQNFEILLIGNKSEYLYTEEISSAINDTRVKNTAGTLTIDELISIIANANIMVSNDTGPMHIAFCTNTPIICLFGPCSPEQYGLSENAHIIYKQVYCSPCVHDFIIPPCKGDNVCMKLISPDEVFTSLKQLLEGSSNINTIEKQKYIYKNGNNILGKVIR